MYKKKKSDPKRPVIILGAGASKGARFDHAHAKHTPPLDVDFFLVARDLFSKRRGKNADKYNSKLPKSWERFLTASEKAGIKKGTITEWRLENLSTFLEARANARWEAFPGKPPKYRKALEELKQLICDTLRYRGGANACRLHKMLFNKTSPNAVVSFNYDLIADQTLFQLNKLAWSEKTYSPAKTARLSRAKGFFSKGWYKNKRPSTKGKVKLYKLHGSIHWNKAGRKKGFQIAGIRSFPPAKGEGLKYEKAPLDPFIIPPVAAKLDVKDHTLQYVWTSAKRALRNAPKWIIWGYSFPQTDTITTVLLKTCMEGKKGGEKRTKKKNNSNRSRL